MYQVESETCINTHTRLNTYFVAVIFCVKPMLTYIICEGVSVYSVSTPLTVFSYTMEEDTRVLLPFA